MKDEHAKKTAAGLPAARTRTSERQSMERAALLALSFGQATAFRHAYDPPTHTELPRHTHPCRCSLSAVRQVNHSVKRDGKSYTLYASETLNETTGSTQRGFTLDDAVEMVKFYEDVEVQALSVSLQGQMSEF